MICTHLFLLLSDLHTHVLAHNKASDTLVSLGWVNIGEDLKEEEYEQSRDRRFAVKKNPQERCLPLRSLRSTFCDKISDCELVKSKRHLRFAAV